jgi:hypothetical protein
MTEVPKSWLDRVMDNRSPAVGWDSATVLEGTTFWVLSISKLRKKRTQGISREALALKIELGVSVEKLNLAGVFHKPRLMPKAQLRLSRLTS